MKPTGRPKGRPPSATTIIARSYGIGTWSARIYRLANPKMSNLARAVLVNEIRRHGK